MRTNKVLILCGCGQPHDPHDTPLVRGQVVYCNEQCYIRHCPLLAHHVRYTEETEARP